MGTALDNMRDYIMHLLDNGFVGRKIGAGNGIRTRDPRLGKAMLYH